VICRCGRFPRPSRSLFTSSAVLGHRSPGVGPAPAPVVTSLDQCDPLSATREPGFRRIYRPRTCCRGRSSRPSPGRATRRASGSWAGPGRRRRSGQGQQAANRGRSQAQSVSTRRCSAAPRQTSAAWIGRRAHSSPTPMIVSIPRDDTTAPGRGKVRKNAASG
jgi:hypothetical protein